MHDCPVQHARFAHQFTGKERDSESGGWRRLNAQECFGWSMLSVLESVGLLPLLFSLFHPRPPTPFNSPYDRSTLIFYHSLQNT
jgi:hypothetical protein